MLERLNWKQCLQTLESILGSKLASVYAYGCVDNTKGDATKIANNTWKQVWQRTCIGTSYLTNNNCVVQ